MIVNASDRSGHRGRYVWPWLLLGAAAFYGSYLIGPGHFWLSFPLLVVAGAAMYAPYGPYFAHISEFLPSTAAAPAIALVNSFGALGGFAGSYLVGWLDSTTDGIGHVDAEGELAVVIGTTARHLTAADALDAVLGCTVANDVTARDLQRTDPLWTAAKGQDTLTRSSLIRSATRR